MSRRTEMIGSTLKQELMSIIMRQLNDPRLEGMPSITRVKVASDLSTADVFVTIMGTPGKQSAALNALISSAGMMRQKLKKSLPLRTIPMLKFHIDEALRKELNVLELIDKAVREENELHPQPETTDETTTEEATTEAETTDNELTAQSTELGQDEEREQAHRESEKPAKEADPRGEARAEANR